MFNSLLKPLDVTVWLALIGSLLVLSLALRGTARLSRTGDSRDAAEMTWTSCLFAMFMSLVGQGWSSTPGSLSGRTVTIFGWFLCIIVINSYTAILISHLTVVSQEPPIRSLKEFCEQPDWTLMMRPDHIHLNDWRISDDKYEQKLYRRVSDKENFIPFYRTMESAIASFSPKVLTYVNIDRLFFLLKTQACGLVPLQDQPVEAAATKYNYMVMTKGRSKLRKSMSRVLRKLAEAGILKSLKKRWIKRPKACASVLGARPISFGDSLALLLIVPLGCVASVIILSLEWAWFVRENMAHYWCWCQVREPQNLPWSWKTPGVINLFDSPRKLAQN